MKLVPFQHADHDRLTWVNPDHVYQVVGINADRTRIDMTGGSVTVQGDEATVAARLSGRQFEHRGGGSDA